MTQLNQVPLSLHPTFHMPSSRAALTGATVVPHFLLFSIESLAVAPDPLSLLPCSNNLSQSVISVGARPDARDLLRHMMLVHALTLCHVKLPALHLVSSKHH